MDIIDGRFANIVHHAVVQRMQITTGAKCFIASAFQNQTGNSWVVGPQLNLVREQAGHFKRQAVQGLWCVQCCHTDARTIRTVQFIEQDDFIVVLNSTHLTSAPFSSSWRAIMTRIISLVPSRI